MPQATGLKYRKGEKWLKNIKNMRVRKRLEKNQWFAARHVLSGSKWHWGLLQPSVPIAGRSGAYPGQPQDMPMFKAKRNLRPQVSEMEA